MRYPKTKLTQKQLPIQQYINNKIRAPLQQLQYIFPH